MSKPIYTLTPEERKIESQRIRHAAAKLAFDRQHANHTGNPDEKGKDPAPPLPFKMMSFTKGLPHNPVTGLLMDEADYELFVNGICSGSPDDIAKTPLGPSQEYTSIKDPEERKKQWLSPRGKDTDKLRGWESAGAGLCFDLQGPDAQSLTMSPAPTLSSDELTAELAELYAQAMLRDEPLHDIPKSKRAKKWYEALSQLPYFSQGQRKPFNQENPIPFTLSTMFRGLTPGDIHGPYVSQFLLAGNSGRGKVYRDGGSQNELRADDGQITYGSLTIDQRVRTAKPGQDYMTSWEEYLDVQNGADFRKQEEYSDGTDSIPLRRFITTGRDLATYVHYDALYEAFLNACLLLLATDTPNLFDREVPFQDPDHLDKQIGFTLYGGPHILTLVTEVATRALKAVRFQKFNLHRRLRPEALAGRMEKKDAIISSLNNHPNHTEWAKHRLEKMYNDLGQAGIFDLLPKDGKSKLLPMAFVEGSPMHPAYGAGHATVAGACVTILKAYFNRDLYIDISSDGSTFNLTQEKPKQARAFVPNDTGTRLRVVEIEQPLTVEGELNKLAANISIGRDWAGVHYYSDYKQSLLLGEQVAIHLLEEQALTYNVLEKFAMTVRRFDGKEQRIS